MGKRKFKRSQCYYYDKREGEIEPGNWRKRYIFKSTCRYVKHKGLLQQQHIPDR